MVLIGLQMSAQLENIEELKTSHQDFPFFLKVKCSNCGEVSDKWHDVIESEKTQLDTQNSDGCNLYIKCKMCSRGNSIDVEKSNAAYTEEDASKLKTIVVFDCRDAEPLEFSPKSGWKAAAAENGQKFEDIDLPEDDWVEYDQKNNQSVGIYEFYRNF